MKLLGFKYWIKAQKFILMVEILLLHSCMTLRKTQQGFKVDKWGWTGPVCNSCVTHPRGFLFRTVSQNHSPDLWLSGVWRGAWKEWLENCLQFMTSIQQNSLKMWNKIFYNYQSKCLAFAFSCFYISVPTTRLLLFRCCLCGAFLLL